MQRLHHRPIPGHQPLPHRHQKTVPPGEPRITGWDVPDPRHRPRQARTGTARPAHPSQRAPGREHRLAVRAPRPRHRLQQDLAGLLLGHPEQIPGDQRPQHRGHLPGGYLFHPHRHQPLGALHVDHRGRPFLGGVPGPVEIRRREQRHHPVTPLQRITHRRHEIPARRPVPHIQLDHVPRLGQLPGHPLRPRPVSTGMTDEKVNMLPNHSTSIPATARGCVPRCRTAAKIVASPSPRFSRSPCH
jgi:hypothetical protein